MSQRQLLMQQQQQSSSSRRNSLTIQRKLLESTTKKKKNDGDDGSHRQLNQSSSSLSGGSSSRKKKRSSSDWHKDIQYAIQSGRWENVRGNLQLRTAAAKEKASLAAAKRKKSSGGGVAGGGAGGGFFGRMIAATAALSDQLSDGGSSDDDAGSVGSSGGGGGPNGSLLSLDNHGRTPLHCALASRNAPSDVLQTMIRLEPKATAVRNDRGCVPLHFAVLYRHPVDVVAALIDTNPASLSAVDNKGQSPLAYAVDIAQCDTDLKNAPKAFWTSPSDDDDNRNTGGGRNDKNNSIEDADLDRWQQEQSERWGVVHWLLLSFATYPQNLSVLVGAAGADPRQQQQQPQQPMLVDALLYAAPPPVIMLLIGASVMLLSVENKASAFAGSTLYSCIARHYPLSILESLTMQCPPDVRKVRDETGMGLVAAQFVSGCFVHDFGSKEWKVNAKMLASLERSAREGKLVEDDKVFVEWWKKIEYLISFCGSGPSDVQHLNAAKKREFLLHTALCNSDIPPKVIRLLVALYPDSVLLKHPTSTALPIHLAAKMQVYIPRNYEYLVYTQGGDGASNGGELTETAIAMLIEAKPDTANYRHKRRLPLHIAIDSGKMIELLKPFRLTEKDEHGVCPLEKRDPDTGLYPFQQVAAFAIVSTEDGFRWSCLARNSYSHTEWKALSDRQRAGEIMKVAEAEATDRLSTIYELLRMKPGVLIPPQPRKISAGAFRDARGMGYASLHFLSFIYSQKNVDDWELHPERSAMFEKALSSALESRMLQGMPFAFNKWWLKMRFWIRYCDPPSDNAVAAVVRRAIPRTDDSYLLHAALLNPDTPPKLIEFLLALFPDAPQLPVLDCWFPLHIACLTTSYTPRASEAEEQHSTIELTLKAFPEAVDSRLDDGSLPIHLAIRAGRTWEELWYFVEEHPSSLRSRDPETRLYPFQMLCLCPERHPEQQLQYQYVARNWYKAREWKELAPSKLVSEVRTARREHELAILSSAYEVLRSDPSVIENYNEDYVEPDPAILPVASSLTGDNSSEGSTDDYYDDDHDVVRLSDLVGEVDEDYLLCNQGSRHVHTVIPGGQGHEETSASYADSENSSGDEFGEAESDSERAAVDEDADDSVGLYRASDAGDGGDNKKTPSLMSFFSREEEKKSRQQQQIQSTRSVFECDASVLSGVDVMSLVSGTGHMPSAHRHRRAGRRLPRTDEGDGDDNVGNEGKDKSTEARSVSELLFGDSYDDDEDERRRHDDGHHRGGDGEYHDYEDDDDEDIFGGIDSESFASLEGSSDFFVGDDSDAVASEGNRSQPSAASAAVDDDDDDEGEKLVGLSAFRQASSEEEED